MRTAPRHASTNHWFAHFGLARTYVVSWCIALASITGCGTHSVSEQFTERDSLDVVIQESAAALWDRGSRWRIVGEPSVAIGVVEGEPEYLFDRIVSVERIADGTLVVADRGSDDIRAYDSSGQFLRRLGGPGNGPGEFQSIGSITVRADSMYAFDGALSRLTVFTVDGVLIETVSMDATGDPVHPLRMYGVAGFIGDDLALVARAFPADMRPEPVTYWDSLPTLSYGRDGGRIGSIGEHAGMDTYSTPQMAGAMTFARFSSADVDDNLLYMTDGGTYEVRVYDGQRLVRVVRTLVEPRPAEGRPMRSDWPHRTTLPWISGVVVDDTGNVWVREYRPRFEEGPNRWSVFRAEDGRWLGRLDMPEGFTPHRIGADYLLGVMEDELEIQYVHLYTLTRSG